MAQKYPFGDRTVESMCCVYNRMKKVRLERQSPGAGTNEGHSAPVPAKRSLAASSESEHQQDVDLYGGPSKRSRHTGEEQGEDEGHLNSQTKARHPGTRPSPSVYHSGQTSQGKDAPQSKHRHTDGSADASAPQPKSTTTTTTTTAATHTAAAKPVIKTQLPVAVPAPHQPRCHPPHTTPSHLSLDSLPNLPLCNRPSQPRPTHPDLLPLQLQHHPLDMDPITHLRSATTSLHVYATAIENILTPSFRETAHMRRQLTEQHRGITLLIDRYRQCQAECAELQVQVVGLGREMEQMKMEIQGGGSSRGGDGDGDADADS
ncbi:hypothetical protein BJX61DRAFT_539279 [Aspergillus egyptiacus]|nr:hypothetical protein BJX61DRAFT_539279 [Aspergillus egyptiacus]